MIFVIEVIVQLYYVWVIEVILNFQLIYQLRKHFVLCYCRFQYFLQGEEKIGLFVSADMDVSEFTRTDAFSQLKVRYFQRTSDGLGDN